MNKKLTKVSISIIHLQLDISLWNMTSNNDIAQVLTLSYIYISLWHMVHEYKLVHDCLQIQSKYRQITVFTWSWPL